MYSLHSSFTVTRFVDCSLFIPYRMFCFLFYCCCGCSFKTNQRFLSSSHSLSVSFWHCCHFAIAMIMMKCHRINEHKTSTVELLLVLLFIVHWDFRFWFCSCFASTFISLLRYSRRAPCVFIAKYVLQNDFFSLFVCCVFCLVWPFQSTLQFVFFFIYISFICNDFVLCRRLNNIFFWNVIIRCVSCCLFSSLFRFVFTCWILCQFVSIVGHNHQLTKSSWCTISLHAFWQRQHTNFLLCVNSPFFSFFFFIWNLTKINILLFRFVFPEIIFISNFEWLRQTNFDCNISHRYTQRIVVIIFPSTTNETHCSGFGKQQHKLRHVSFS